MAQEPLVPKDEVILNPPAMTPLRPPDAKRGIAPAPPAMVSQPRPMLPPPPMPLRPPKPRGVLSPMSKQERPKSPYAMTLEEMAKLPRQRPRMCPECGGTRRINEIRDKKNAIVGFSPCPRCVEL